MKIIKKIPKWTVIALVALIVTMISWNLVQHFAVRHRVSEQRQRIQQQQERVSQAINEKRVDGRFWFDENTED